MLDLKVDNHTIYEHHHSIGEFHTPIADVLMADVCLRMLQSDNFINMLHATHLLGVSDLHLANAECIFSKVSDMLADKGIDLQKSLWN